MTVNFGIIGFGKMAEICHKGILEKVPGARLLAVADITPARREAAKGFGIERVYSSAAQLLKDPDIQAVSITTPSHIHYNLALQAAKAGKHVLSEKPVSRSVAELKKMMAACKKAGVVFTVFHNRRYDSDFLAARDVIRKKLVGEVVCVERRWQGYGSAAGFGTKDYLQKWREMKKYGGGTLLDLGVHCLDQLNQMMPGKPVSVFARVWGGVWGQDCDDYCSGLVRFDDGLTAFVEASAITRVNIVPWRIIGTKGMAVSNVEKKGLDLYLGSEKEPSKFVSYDKPSDWGYVYRTFVAAIKDRSKKPAVDPASVITTMQLIEAYGESSRKKQSVTINGPRLK